MLETQKTAGFRGVFDRIEAGRRAVRTSVDLFFAEFFVPVWFRSVRMPCKLHPVACCRRFQNSCRCIMARRLPTSFPPRPCPKCGTLVNCSGALDVGGQTLGVYQCEICTQPTVLEGLPVETCYTWMVDAKGRSVDPSGIDPSLN